MAKPILKIDDFSSGVVEDPTEPIRNGMQSLVGIDYTKKEGLIQLARKVYATNLSNGTLENIVDSFENFQGKVFMIERGGASYDLKIWRRIGNVFNLTSGHTIAGSGSNTRKYDLITYSTRMYYIYSPAASSKIGYTTDGSMWNDNQHTLTNTLSGNPSVLAGVLYIPNGDELASIDASTAFAFANDVFNIPADNIMTCTAIYQNEIVIGTSPLEDVSDPTDSDNPLSNRSLVYFWDGISAKPTRIIEVNADGCFALKIVDNILYLLAGKDGAWYQWNGSDFDLVRRIPDADLGLTEYYPNAMEVQDDDLLFGAGVAPQSGAANFVCGIWRWGKMKRLGSGRSLSMPYSLVEPSGEQNRTRSRVTALLNTRYVDSGDQKRLFIAGTYWDGNSEETTVGFVDFFDGVDYLARNAYMITQKYELGDDDSELLQGFQMLNASDDFETVTYKYRIDTDTNNDDDTGWTTLGTVADTDRFNDILYGIYKRARIIQFRVDLSSNDGTIQEQHKISKFNIY